MDRRYGGSWAQRLQALFAREGLPFDETIERVPRSFDALRVAELAVSAGLVEGEVREVLEGERYGELVAASTQGAIDAGASGVPAFAVDNRILIPGAQPEEVFEQVMDRLGYAAA